MLYPGYVPVGGLLPSILHYGADYTIEGDVHSMGHPNMGQLDLGHPNMGTPDAWDAHRASSVEMLSAAIEPAPDDNLLQWSSGKEVYFNKMNQVHLDLYDIARQNGCEMTLAHTRAESGAGTPSPRERLEERLARAASSFEVEGFFFFEQPPPPRFADGRARTKRDLLCIEHLRVLNDAICRFYKERCGEPSQWRCTGQHGRDLDLQRALRECHDTHSLCPVYASSGECARNPIWMLSECAASCGLCDADNQLNPLTRTMLMRQIEPYELIGANARRPPEVLGLEHLDGHEEEDGECAREGEALADDS